MNSRKWYNSSLMKKGQQLLFHTIKWNSTSCCLFVHQGTVIVPCVYVNSLFTLLYLYTLVYLAWTKTVCKLVRPKQSQGRYSTKVRLRKEELGFVEEFRYLGHVMTADCRDDKDIKKQFRRKIAVGNMLVWKFSFAPVETKIQLFKSCCYPIYGCALWWKTDR